MSCANCDPTSMTVVRRDDASFELTFTDVDGNAIDLTNGTVFFTVKKKLTDPDEEAYITQEITLFDDPDSGIALLELSNTDTNIAPGKYYFDVQLLTGDDKVTSSNAGSFIVSQDVTQRIT